MLDGGIEQRTGTPKTKKDLKNSAKLNIFGGEMTNEERIAVLLDQIKDNPAYAHVDVKVEMGKMEAWILAHPGRRITPRFIINWLNREKPQAKEVPSPKYLDRMCAFFNRRLTGEQVAFWVDRFGNEKEEDLIKAVDSIIANERYFPTPIVLSQYITRFASEKKRFKVTDDAPCEQCNSTGFVTAYNQRGASLFRCDKCTRSSNLVGSPIPLWAPETFIEHSLKDPKEVNDRGREFLSRNSPKSYGKIFGEMPKVKENFKDQMDVEAKKQRMKEDLKNWSDNQGDI